MNESLRSELDVDRTSLRSYTMALLHRRFQGYFERVRGCLRR